MKLTVCSIFRDSVGYVPRYFHQIDRLREHVDVNLVLAEGDSTDETMDHLLRLVEPPDVLLHVAHGGAKYGSIDHPVRWDQIASVVRPVIERALRDDPDMVMWVESDLVWDTGNMLRLIDGAKNGRAVAPMALAEGSKRFYDVWGYRVAKVGFNAYEPYWPGQPETEDGYVKIDSCGSCFVTPEPERHLRTWSGHWPFGAAGELWLDTAAEVRHP